MTALRLDDAALRVLGDNAARLAHEALVLLARDLDQRPPAAPAPAPTDALVLALLDPAAMDLGLLDALDGDGDGDATAAAPPGTDRREAIAGCLAELPPGLPPLTTELDDAAFAAWLTLYRGGDEALHRLVACLQAGR